MGGGNFLIDSEFKVVASLFLFAGLATFYWLLIGRHLQARKMHNETQRLVDNYEIDHDGIIRFYNDMEDEKTSIRWSDASLCVESKSHFLLYNKKEILLLFPKRAFANEADLNQFRAWASQINSELAQTPPLPEPK